MKTGASFNPAASSSAGQSSPGALAASSVALPRDRGMYVLRFDARGMRLRHLRFEREHACGAGRRVREARQLEHRRDVRLVLLAQLGHVRSCGEIVVAIRHSETALQQIGIVVRWVRQALRDPDSEEVPGLEVGVVQRIHIRAQLAAQHAGESMAIRDGRDRVELRLQRRDSLRLDGRFIHEARVKIADLPGVPACGRSCVGRFLNERAASVSASGRPVWRRRHNSTCRRESALP